MDLLRALDENKTKIKNKKYFCKSCLQCFSNKNVLTEPKEVCLSINGAQSVKSEKGTIKACVRYFFYQIFIFSSSD